MNKPIVPNSSPMSTDPEDVQAWEDYYAECENWADAQKPCMDRNDYPIPSNHRFDPTWND